MIRQNLKFTKEKTTNPSTGLGLKNIKKEDMKILFSIILAAAAGLIAGKYGIDAVIAVVLGEVAVGIINIK